MKSIFVVGSINTDLSIHAPHEPEKGETLAGDCFMISRGGKGANQAVAAARLGGKVHMCGCVGGDVFGKEALNALRKEGINTDGVRTVEGVPTGVAVITVVDADNRIIIDSGANACLSTADIDRFLDNAKSGDILITQLENPVSAVGYALKRAKGKGMFTILNPAPYSTDIMPYIGYCDVIVPNESEFTKLGGESIVRNCNADIVLTLGGSGHKIFSRGKEESFSCIKIDAVDTTGAGDTFCGGMCVKLACGQTLAESARYGSLCASIACTVRGAQSAIPTKEGVEKFLIANVK